MDEVVEQLFGQNHGQLQYKIVPTPGYQAAVRCADVVPGVDRPTAVVYRTRWTRRGPDPAFGKGTVGRVESKILG
jgi:hypothetical protein